ncbi:MAG: DUF4251 domain-containing protein [Bacteroidales bacterium]|nr:DUF4251 domain-containing protein [Bacteroidales bacterium]
MKTNVTIVVALMMVTFHISSCSTVSKTSDPRLRAELLSKADARDLDIQVREMIPMQGNSQFLTPEYHIAVKGDTVISHLPYFGRAYSAPYSGGNVFSFKAPLLSYKVDDSRKTGPVRITFSTKTIDDTFTFHIDLFENRKASVRVSAVNRQGISYSGELSD